VIQRTLNRLELQYWWTWLDVLGRALLLDWMIGRPRVWVIAWAPVVIGA